MSRSTGAEPKSKYEFKKHEIDAEGANPLHRAAQSNREIEVLKLLKMGADVNAKTLAGETPLHRAVSVITRTDPITEILRGGEELKTPPLITIGATNTLAVLLKTPGVDVNAQDNEGFTPLDVVLLIKDNLSRSEEGATFLYSHTIERLKAAGAKTAGELTLVAPAPSPYVAVRDLGKAANPAPSAGSKRGREGGARR